MRAEMLNSWTGAFKSLEKDKLSSPVKVTNILDIFRHVCAAGKHPELFFVRL